MKYIHDRQDCPVLWRILAGPVFFCLCQFHMCQLHLSSGISLLQCEVLPDQTECDRYRASLTTGMLCSIRVCRVLMDETGSCFATVQH
jgi:hypothetical protein